MLAPLIGVVLAIVLLVATDVIHRPHEQILEKLNQTDLPKVGEFSQVTILLVQNHSQLVEVLVSAIGHQNEERVYIDGRATLDSLHEIEKKLLLSLSGSEDNIEDEIKDREQVELLFSDYRESAISAIELSTVNPERARVELLSAQKALDDLLQTVLLLTEHHVLELKAGSELVQNSIGAENSVKWLAAAMIILMIVSAVYFSTRMSKDLDQVNNSLLALSRGDTRIELPERADPYLSGLLDAVLTFRQTLLENEHQRHQLIRTVRDLKATQYGLSQAQKIAHMGSWELDLVNNQLIWSDEIFRIFEKDPERFEASFEGFLESIHPDDRAFVEQAYQDSVRNRTLYDIEHRLLMQDGRIKYVNERCETSYDEQGNPIQSVGTVLDITERKRAEQALQQSRSQLRTLIDTLPDLVWMKDPQGFYLACNSKFERFFGAKEADIIGKTDHDFVDQELADFFRQKDKAAMAAGGPTINEEEVTYADDGHIEFLETIKTPVHDHDGTVIGVLGVGRDITQRKAAEAALQASEEWFKAITQQATEGITVADTEGNYTFVNTAFVDMIGYTEEELLSMTVFDVKAPEQDTGSFERSKTSKEGLPIEVVLQRKDGSTFISEVVGKMIEISGESHVLGTIRDVSAQVQAEEQIRTLYEAIEQSPVSVMITNTEAQLEYVNSAFVKVTGYSLEEVLGKDPNIIKSNETPAEVYRELWRALNSGEVWEGELLNKKKDGTLFWEYCHFAPVIDEYGRTRNFLAVKEDITERKHQEELILRQAHFDSLTGLPNRFLSLDRLTQLISEAQRNRDKVAVLFLDLDDFKKINDTLGHETGDKLLIEASSRLSNALRRGDTVGRLGGDEFIVLLGGLDVASDAQPIAENLLHCFRKAFPIDGRELMLTASIGIAVYPEDSDNASELLRKSDSAMYHSKEAGRNTYSYFTEQMNREVSRRLELEEQIHGALGRHEFSVQYQPRIDLRSGKIMGAEALLRWHNPALGHVPPDEFIPIAEQTGLILQIGQYVLEQALTMTAHWQKRHDPCFRIAVNLSPRQFRDPGLVEYIEQMIRQAGINCEHLELEITEGVLLSGHTYIEETVSGLSALGVGIAMDDFGTGYSSLSYLRSFPFNVLKIDRSFINDITIDPADRELITAIVAMSQSLKLTVVAEGVETKDQFSELKEIGCDCAQGYLFSKPVSGETLEAMLESSQTYLM